MVVWNTGSAAARYRLKNKKKIKPQATSFKQQAASGKLTDSVERKSDVSTPDTTTESASFKQQALDRT